jgi:hypothetical protein
MTIRLTFKTPDVVHRAIQDAALDADGTEDREEIEKAVDKWVRWGEQVTIEVNTKTGEATVIPA